MSPDFSNTPNEPLWREVSAGTGRARLTLRVARTDVSLEALRAWSLIRHPNLLELARVSCEGRVMQIESGVLRTGATGVASQSAGPVLPMAVDETCGNPFLSLAGTRPTIGVGPLGETRFAPLPGTLLRAHGAGDNAAAAWFENDPSTYTIAGFQDERVLAGRALLLAAAGPQLVLLRGERGSGRTTLLELIAIDAGISGARVEWSIPDEPGRSEAPLVILLDDIETSPGQLLGRLSLLAERSARPLAVFAVPRGEGAVAGAVGFSVDELRVTPAVGNELLFSGRKVTPRVGADVSVLREAKLRSGDNPRRFHLWKELLVRGETGSDLGRALESVVSRLTEGARTLAQLTRIAGESADTVAPELLESALGSPAGAAFEELRPWLVVDRQGQLRLVREMQQTLAASSTDSTRHLHRRLAAAFADDANSQLRRAIHELGAGEQAAALRATSRGLIDTGDPQSDLRLLALLEARGLVLDAELMAVKARICQRVGRLPEALRLLTDLAAACPDVAARASYQLERVELLARSGELRQAEGELSKIDRSEAMVAARASFTEGFVQYRCGALDSARVAYQQGLAVAGSHEWLRARGLSGLGYTMVRSPGGSRKGERMLAEAREIYGRLGIPDELSRVISREGSARSRRGDLAGGMARHLEALEVALSAGDQSGAAECHVDIASVAFDLGELRRSERHLEEAVRLFEEARDPRAETLAGVNLAVVAMELGRPGDAETLFRAAARRDEDAGARWHLAHDLRFLGMAMLALGKLAEAESTLNTAVGIFRELEDDEGRSEVQHVLAVVALDRGDPRAARKAAEAGLLAVAERAPASLSARLKVAAARARLELDPADRTAREIGAAVAMARESADASVRAEGALLELLAMAGTASGSARLAAPVERAIGLAEAQERPDITARTLALVLSRAADGLSAERAMLLVERLRELHREPERRGRLEVLGIRATLTPSPQPQLLEQDSLVTLDHALAREPDQRLDSVVEFLVSRVPCGRAAVLLPEDGRRLRVVARYSAVPAADPPGAMALALSLGEKARVTGEPVVLDAEETSALLAGDQARAPGLGASAAIPAGSGLVLYLDRPRAMSAFAPAELYFVAALARRLDEFLLRIEVLAAAKNGTARRSERVAAGESLNMAEDLGLIGVSGSMRRLRQEIRDLAAVEIPVFLHGESGSGKELVARALHGLSRRRTGAYVAINCAALPEALLESELFGAARGAFTGAVSDREGLLARADRGILFLDEVAEMSLGIQAKLLRVVESGEFRPLGSSQLKRVDVRFLAATNRDVFQAVREGRFREDLYYRLLSTATIELPPLRERGGDIAVLCSFFAQAESARQECPAIELSRAALACIESHPFPGNVRELERLIAGLTARHHGRRVELEDIQRALKPRLGLAGPTAGTGTLAAERERSERRYLEDLLDRHAGNRTRAALTAGIARQTLIAMLKRHQLAKPDVGSEMSVNESGELRSPYPGVVRDR